MRFGLWFGTVRAAQSCWDYPAALADEEPLAVPYRLGNPDEAHAGCLFGFARELLFKTLGNGLPFFAITMTNDG